MKRTYSFHLAIVAILILLMPNAALSNTTETAGDYTEKLMLAPVFGDNMVLQRHAPVTIWGWGNAGKVVSVSISSVKDKDNINVIASAESDPMTDAEGTWKVTLPAQKAGGPYVMSVRCGDFGEAPVQKMTVFFGDVFLFSGQSNMELPIRRCMDNFVVNALAPSYTNNDVHIMKLPQQFGFVDKQTDCQRAPWQSINPQTAPNIGALTYFVGKELHEYAKVPIGIINSSVGGTRIECWLSREALLQFPEYQEEMQKRKYTWSGWVDSVRRAENARADAWEHRLAVEDPISNQWRKKGYSFQSWKKVDIFKPFHDSEKPHGSYWFHNTFNLPKDVADACGQYTLRLGAMKDADSVFVNGHFVGTTSYEYPPRNYNVPSEYLHAGKNDVVIHLMAQKGTPNFTKDKKYELALGGGGAIPLDRGWQMIQSLKMEPKPSQSYFVDTPNGLYNAMIHPLGQVPICGIVWYQGESNVGNPHNYKEYMKAMVAERRAQFPYVPCDATVENATLQNGNVPFVCVQLAGYQGTHEGIFDSGWCKIRNEQRLAAEEIPAASLATAIDCGEWNDIHPQDKPTISHRVALQLRHLYYKDSVLSEGPKAVKAVKNGDDIVVTFAPETGELRQFKDDFAEVTGPYELTIHRLNASSTYTFKDGKFRYANDDCPRCTIYNTAALPAPQFEIVVE